MGQAQNLDAILRARFQGFNRQLTWPENATEVKQKDILQVLLVLVLQVLLSMALPPAPPLGLLQALQHRQPRTIPLNSATPNPAVM